eukprot:2137262-Rhodomonas_salina.4
MTSRTTDLGSREQDGCARPFRAQRTRIFWADHEFGAHAGILWAVPSRVGGSLLDQPNSNTGDQLNLGKHQFGGLRWAHQRRTTGSSIQLTRNSSEESEGSLNCEHPDVEGACSSESSPFRVVERISSNVFCYKTSLGGYASFVLAIGARFAGRSRIGSMMRNGSALRKDIISSMLRRLQATSWQVKPFTTPRMESLIRYFTWRDCVACGVPREGLECDSYVPPCPSPVPFLRPSLQPLPGTFHCALASLPAVPVVQPYFSHAFLSVPRLCFPCSYPYSPFPHRRPFHPRGVSRATPPRGNALRAAAVAGVRKHVRIRHAHSSPADTPTFCAVNPDHAVRFDRQTQRTDHRVLRTRAAVGSRGRARAGCGVGGQVGHAGA